MTFVLSTLVPSANKRDIRSIEETLKDLRSKKKAKLLNDDDIDQWITWYIPCICSLFFVFFSFIANFYYYNKKINK